MLVLNDFAFEAELAVDAAVVDVERAQQAQELMLEGTSMDGARPKAIVEDDGAMWSKVQPA